MTPRDFDTQLAALLARGLRVRRLGYVALAVACVAFVASLACWLLH